MALFGTVQFGRISKILSADFTLTQGISPSVATLVIPPTPGAHLLTSTMTWRYGNSTVRFPMCRVDTVDIAQDSQGATKWRLRVMDRRWMWRETGQISGQYNTRKAGGGIIEGTQKNARELAELCFAAMQEKGVAKLMPTAVYPEVEWDYDNPAEALAALCDSLNFVVVLGANSQVELWPKNMGRQLPSHGSLEGGISIDPPDPPGEIVIVGDKVRWQVDLPLEPGGLEKDGSVKPINKLSYTPRISRPVGRKSWALADFPHFHAATDKEIGHLARSTVYRWFRIKDKFWVPGVGWINRPRILPLEDAQIELGKPTKAKKGEKEPDPAPRPPWVWGVFARGYDDTTTNVAKRNADLDKQPEGIYSKGFEIDAENGIVKFADMVAKYEELPWVGPGSSKQVVDPELYLRIAITIREKDASNWFRQVFAEKQKKSKHPKRKRYISVPELAREIYIKQSKPRKLIDNYKGLLKESKVYLAKAALEYQATNGGTFTYPGFLPIPVDGAIRQVTWSLTSQGFAITRASRAQEDLMLGSGYDERRFMESLRKVIDENAKATGRSKRREARKARGR